MFCYIYVIMFCINNRTKIFHLGKTIAPLPTYSIAFRFRKITTKHIIIIQNHGSNTIIRSPSMFIFNTSVKNIPLPFADLMSLL